MATLTLTLPVIVKLANTSDTKIPFQPYHENFTVSIPAGTAVEFEVDTAGQYFYYVEQATSMGLEVSKLNAFDIASDTIVVIDLPSLVTLTNSSTHAVQFIPYRENFPVTIGVGDAVVIEALTAGQVFAYLAQAQGNSGITVTFAAKA